MTSSPFHLTDYVELDREIGRQIDELASADYSTCVERLVEATKTYFTALNYTTNPVATRIAEWRPPALRFLIREYSVFSNAAIHMFLEARIRNQWLPLNAEIIRNMDEEMGALTEGVPHLELMREGYRRDLQIETDDIVPTAITRDFIERMNSLFRRPNNEFLAGALLAFETTATDEFRVVETMLRTYKSELGGELGLECLTGQYIAGHVAVAGADAAVDPEMEHYQGMVDAVGAAIGGRDLRHFIRGFLAVCLELNRWWEQLTHVALYSEVRKRVDKVRRGSDWTSWSSGRRHHPEGGVLEIHAPVA